MAYKGSGQGRVRKGRTMMRDWLRTFLFTAVWLWTRRQSPSINDCWKKSLPLFLCPALAARAVEVAGAEEYVPSSRPSGGEKKKGRKEEEEGGRARSFGQAWE